MHSDLTPLLTITWAIGFGLLAQVLAHRWKIPAIVLLLFIGVVLGPGVWHLIDPSTLGDGLSILVKLAIAVILFEGALNLRLSELRQSLHEVRNLITIGVLVNWGLITLISHYVAGLEWLLAILFGALMTVTGPTVVHPLLKRVDVNRKVKAVLEGEAILIDPIGAILAIAVFEIVIGNMGEFSVGVLPALWEYFGRLFIGLVVGIIAAIVLSYLIKIPNLVPADLSNLVTLAGVWAAFGVAEMILSEAGIMASLVMGLMLQRESLPGERQLRQFKGSLTTLSISILFILLAADLKLESIWAEGVTGLLTVLLIMFVARPIGVFLSTWRTRLTWREKAFIAWIGPRGIIAASVASLFALSLKEIGMAGSERLISLTFLTIAITVTVQGLTASMMVNFLRLHSMEGRSILIVGAGRLAMSIAKILEAHGRETILIDTNLDNIEKARENGLEVIQGNALEEDILELANAEEAETLIAVTSNSEVNVLASQIGFERFGIKRTFPTLTNPAKGAGSKLLQQMGGKLVFGKPIDVYSWEQAGAQFQEISWDVPETWPTSKLSNIRFPDKLLPVARIRDKSTEVTHAEQVWQYKDRVIFLAQCSTPEAKSYLETLTRDNVVSEMAGNLA